MPKIAEKVRNECRPGTYVLSYRFLIPCMDESGVNENISSINNNRKKHLERIKETKDENTSLDAMLVYDKEEMRIYELRHPKN